MRSGRNEKVRTMRYVTGIHALNIPNSTDTPGDWHASALAWEKITYLESDETPFGDWGIERDIVPFVDPDAPVFHADDVRACLDLIFMSDFAQARGMRESFIDNEEYTPVVFEMVELLAARDNWPEIDAFMSSEYRLAWLAHKERRGE